MSILKIWYGMLIKSSLNSKKRNLNKFNEVNKLETTYQSVELLTRRLTQYDLFVIITLNS